MVLRFCVAFFFYLFCIPSLYAACSVTAGDQSTAEVLFGQKCSDSQLVDCKAYNNGWICSSKEISNRVIAHFNKQRVQSRFITSSTRLSPDSSPLIRDRLSLEEYAKSTDKMMLCRTTKSSALLVEHFPQNNILRFDGRFNKGDYIIPLGGVQMHASGGNHVRKDFLRYDKTRGATEVVSAVVSEDGFGLSDEYITAYSCHYYLTRDLVLKMGSDILLNEGYFSQVGQEVISAYGFHYPGAWKKGANKSYRLKEEVKPGERFSLIQQGVNGYSMIGVKKDNVRHVSWLREPVYLTEEKWASHAQIVEKNARSALIAWILYICMFCAISVALMSLPQTAAIVGGASEMLYGMLRRFWWLWLISGAFLLWHLSALAAVDGWEHGQNVGYEVSVWRGLIGIPFIALLPIVVYLGYLSLAIMRTSAQARKAVNTMVPKNPKEEAAYEKLHDMISGDEPGEKGMGGSFWEKIRVDAMTEELQAKKAAYEEFIAMARTREHAKDVGKDDD